MGTESLRRKLKLAADLSKQDSARLTINRTLGMSGYPAGEPEFTFSESGRRWRFDAAWPKYKVALEIQGGGWVGGRHGRGKGLELDAEKLTAAQLEGWLVVVATYKHVENNLAALWVMAAIEVRRDLADALSRDKTTA